MVLRLTGVDPGTKVTYGIKVPTTFVVADLGYLDGILSYGWSAENNFMVNSRRHRICLTDPKKWEYAVG